MTEKLRDERNTLPAQGSTRPLHASRNVYPPYIFGLHDPGDWRDIFERAGKRGWVMFNQVLDERAETIGNPEFTQWARQDFGVLARLVNAPFDGAGQGRGSIPLPQRYSEFAERCAQFAASSPGCQIWFIGNEMNIEWHWPTPQGEQRSIPITPGQYAHCFAQVYEAIKRVQPDAWVIPSGLNPLKKPDARHDDARKWFEEMVQQIKALDGFDLHAYFPLANGKDTDKAYTYAEFLEWIPADRRDLPVFLTEASPPEVWPEKSEGWMQRTYAEVNRRNHNPGHQTIYALLPYRWGREGEQDIWALANKPSYRKDLRQALEYDYRWRFEPGERFGDPLDQLEALQRIKLVDAEGRGDSRASSEVPLFNVPADAYVLPTDTELELSFRQQQRIMRRSLETAAQSQSFSEILPEAGRRGRSMSDLLFAPRELGPVPLGQAAVTEAGILEARHLIFAPVREAGEPTSDEKEAMTRGLQAALILADRLGDVQRLALPAIVDAAGAAEAVLSTIVEHLQAGSRLQQIAIVPVDEEQYRAYADVLASLGENGEPPPDKPQFWFVTGRPENWDRAFQARRVAWTEVKGGRAQQNLRQARAGDVVLAYRSTPAQYITGLGRISGEPYPYQDRYAVDIELDLELTRGVTLAELRQTVPDLEHINIPRLSFSTLTAEQWAVIRDLLVNHNPDLDPDDLPPATVPLERRIDVKSAIDQEEDDEAALVETVYRSGRAAQDQELFDEARRLFEQSLAEYEKLEDQAGIAKSLHQLGRVAKEQENYEEARERFQRSLQIDRGLENEAGVANSLHELGWLAVDLGRNDEAYDAFQRSLSIYRELGDERHIAHVQLGLGRIAREQGDYDRAQQLVQESLHIFEELGDEADVSDSLHSLGQIAQERGDLDEADRFFRRSLEIDEQLGNEKGKAYNLLSLGQIAYDRGAYDHAIERCQESLEIFEALGRKIGMANSLLQLGHIARNQKEYDKARAFFGRSLDLFEQIGFERDVAHVKRQMDSLAEEVEGPKPAERADEEEPADEIIENARVQIRAKRASERIKALNSMAGYVRDDQWDDEQRIRLIQVMWQAFDTEIEPYQQVRRTALGQIRSLAEDRYGVLVEQALAARDDLHQQITLALSDEYIAAGDRQWLQSLLTKNDIAIATEVRRARIEDIEVPDTLKRGTKVEARLRVYNAGDAAWQAGEKLLVTCRWRAADSQASDPPAFEQEWPRPVGAEAVAPESEIVLGGLTLTVDVSAGIYKTVWTVRGQDWGQDDQPGAARGRISVLPKKEVVSQEPGARTKTPAAVAPAVSPAFFIHYTPKEPPPRDNTVTIEVNAQQVSLRYGQDGPYTSFNLLADEAYQKRVNQARQEGTPDTYGRLLFEAIINDQDREDLWSDPTSEGYALAMAQTGGRLRWELVLNAYADYEWECLRDARQHLAVREDAPLYRRFYKQADRNPVEANPLKILVAICNPTDLNAPYPPAPEVEDLHPLKVDQQRFIIEKGLERLRVAGLAEYEILDNEHLDGRSEPGVTLGLLREKLQEGYHVLHLLAHGLYALDRERIFKYHLAMELPNGRRRLEPAERFDQTFLGGKLRLVILAACQSATPGAQHMLRGMGAHLVNQGVPAVISMRGNVPIETVQLFTQRFYDDLARSGRIDMAMAATRGNIYQPNRKSWDWSIPVLMMSTDDGQLFKVDEQRAYERLSRLEPDIKSYEDLPGGDPRLEQMAQALAARAQAIGAPAHLMSMFQMMASPALAQPSSQARSKPRAPRQDRGAMSVRLSTEFEFDSDLLRRHVEENSGLKLPAEVYAQTASALNAGKHVIFIGAPGTGKTSLAHDICTYAETHPSKEQSMSTGNILTTATADWTTFDTVGGYVPTPEGTLEFEPGIFLRAVYSGQWLVIDEINRAEIDKAFGELFTLLSERQVDLPYKVGEERLRVLPPAGKGADWAGKGRRGYDYVMHPNWRILATMNVYDKSYLFQMSFAFMRRFAFVDVDLPDEGTYRELREGWIGESPLKDAPGPYNQELEKLLDNLFYEQNNLMQRRALGPAIAKDVIYYVGDRFKHAGRQEQEVTALPGFLAEAFLLYAVPQFDALDQAEIRGIYKYVGELFGYAAVEKGILDRIEALYPHVREWPDRPKEGQAASPEVPGASSDEDNE